MTRVLERDVEPHHWEKVLENRGLVGFVVNRLPFSVEDREEAEQDGLLGLLRAVQRFDPTLGHRFSTYAVPWIRRYVQEGRERREGSNYRRAARAGERLEPPYSLEAPLPGHEDSEHLDFIELLAAGPDERFEPMEDVERLAAACSDDLDRALLWAMAVGDPVSNVALDHGYSRGTARRRIRLIRRRAGFEAA